MAGSWGMSCWRNSLQKTVAIELGHVDIHDVEIEGRLQGLFQGLDAVHRLLNRVAGGFKNAAVIHAHRGRVIDNQDAFHSWPPWRFW